MLEALAVVERVVVLVPELDLALELDLAEVVVGLMSEEFPFGDSDFAAHAPWSTQTEELVGTSPWVHHCALVKR